MIKMCNLTFIQNKKILKTIPYVKHFGMEFFRTILKNGSEKLHCYTADG